MALNNHEVKQLVTRALANTKDGEEARKELDSWLEHYFKRVCKWDLCDMHPDEIVSSLIFTIACEDITTGE